MRSPIILLFLLIISLLVAACAGPDDGTSTGPQGPALVMFTTDN